MRQTYTYRPLRPDARWPSTVGDVLGSDARARRVARAILWEQVQYFIEHVVKLPIGPLNDDVDARRDIALGVLAKLEANGCAHLAEWLARQVRQQDHASFWGLVRTVLRTVSIDYARSSRLNIARRSDKKFQWIRIDCVDSRLLGEVLGNPRSFIACGSEQEVDEFLADAEDSQCDDDETAVELRRDRSCRP